MIKRRKMRLNGEWQLDGRNHVYELREFPPIKMVTRRFFFEPSSSEIAWFLK
jgi:hypothetical protein